MFFLLHVEVGMNRLISPSVSGAAGWLTTSPAQTCDLSRPIRAALAQLPFSCCFSEITLIVCFALVGGDCYPIPRPRPPGNLGQPRWNHLITWTTSAPSFDLTCSHCWEPPASAWPRQTCAENLLLLFLHCGGLEGNKRSIDSLKHLLIVIVITALGCAREP